MLVISLKERGGVILTLPDGREVRVVVVEVHGRGQVRLGFEADRDILVRRAELPPREGGK